MEKKLAAHQHEKNMLRLWTPALWTASLGAISIASGALLMNDLPAYFTYATIVGAGILMLTIPVGVTCLARTVEYDRLRTEILRGSARIITNPRIDKLINKFFATRSRQYTCALALSTLEMGLDVDSSLAQVRKTHESRRKRLVPPTIFSRGWWLAHFTPVDL